MGAKSLHSNNLLVNVNQETKNKLLHLKFVTYYKTDRYCQLKMRRFKTTRKLVKKKPNQAQDSVILRVRLPSSFASAKFTEPT